MQDQERANALIEKANALHNAGDKLQAAPLYVQAAQSFSPFGTFALVAGDTFASANQDPEAIEAYRLCIASAPDHDQAWLGLGKVLLRAGQADEARAAYIKAGAAFPGDRSGCLARWFGR